MSVELVFLFYSIALVAFVLAAFSVVFAAAPRITQVSFVAIGLAAWLIPSWWNALEAM